MQWILFGAGLAVSGLGGLGLLITPLSAFVLAFGVLVMLSGWLHVKGFHFRWPWSRERAGEVGSSGVESDTDAQADDDGAEHVGTFAELVADDDVQRTYAFAPDERQHLKELWHWHEHQNAQWREYIRLELLDVDCSHVNEASPYALLRMRMTNFLGVAIRLMRVTESTGTVDVHTLPQLPADLDVRVPRGSESSFDVRLPLYGQVPDHLRTEAREPHPRRLSWVIKGRWWVEVYGNQETAWSPSYELRCTAVANLPT